MNPAERKQFLQSAGLLPMGDDLMAPSFNGTESARTMPEGASNPASMIAGPMGAYARSMNDEPEKPKQQPQAQANGDVDYMAKIKEMLTPEMMEKLRSKAVGNYGGSGGMTP